LVYNGVDLAHFAPRERPARVRPVVLGVGRLTAQKDFSLFLRTAAAIGPRAEFRLAGTGPQEAALRAEAAALGVEMQFLGHVSDTRSLYAEADVLLMTSRFEGTPLTLLEAMAMRLPIVAPRLDGIGEILVSEEEALLVAERTPAALSGAVERLLADPAFARRLAEAAERKVQAHYSSTAMARAVEAIYERCWQQTPASTMRRG
jgi:glycosyltransferase involved in cell wall biosynthesis